MSRIRGEGRSSKQAARYPSKIRAPLPLSIRSNSFLQSYLISRLCKLQGRAVNSRGSSRTRRWAPRSGSCSCSSSYLRSPRRSEPLPFSLPRLSPSLILSISICRILPHNTSKAIPNAKKHPVRLCLWHRYASHIEQLIVH